MSRMQKLPTLLVRDERGITGLETAIVLIAFVVVSSVFAFAALSTGLFSADKSKETINAGLAEASGTLELRGSIIAKESTTTADLIEEIIFQVANAAGGAAVDVTPGETIITYMDVDQLVTLVSGDFTATGLGNADSDSLVEPGGDVRDKAYGPGGEARSRPWSGQDLCSPDETTARGGGQHSAHHSTRHGPIQRPWLMASPSSCFGLEAPKRKARENRARYQLRLVEGADQGSNESALVRDLGPPGASSRASPSIIRT